LGKAYTLGGIEKCQSTTAVGGRRESNPDELAPNILESVGLTESKRPCEPEVAG